MTIVALTTVTVRPAAPSSVPMIHCRPMRFFGRRTGHSPNRRENRGSKEAVARRACSGDGDEVAAQHPRPIDATVRSRPTAVLQVARFDATKLSFNGEDQVDARHDVDVAPAPPAAS